MFSDRPRNFYENIIVIIGDRFMISVRKSGLNIEETSIHNVCVDPANCERAKGVKEMGSRTSKACRLRDSCVFAGCGRVSI